MLIMDLSLIRVVQHSPFPVLCLAFTQVVYQHDQIDGTVRAYAHDDHYLTRSKFNSLLTEMITPQTYKYIYIYTYKTASCLSCIRGSLRLAPKYTTVHHSLGKKSVGYNAQIQICSPFHALPPPDSSLS